MTALATIAPVLGLLAAPGFAAIVQRTKAVCSGRRGPAMAQPYRDLAKLLRKGAVYSTTTTWVFRAGPIVTCAATVLVLGFLPWGRFPALLAFPGDFVFVVYLLAAARFAQLLAALDTGSSFEGMGASREALVSCLAEPALLLALATMARASGGLSLSNLSATFAWRAGGAGPVLWFVAAGLFLVFLAENARIPFDDPATHLELTMLHEAMLLDHGGPDLALYEYASSVKLWALGLLVVDLTVPVHTGSPWLDAAAVAALLVALAVATGVVESTRARVRLLRLPHLLIGASAMSAIALALLFSVTP